MKKLALIIVLFGVLSGCAYFTHYYQTGAERQEGTDYRNIKIYSGTPEQKFIVLGGIATEAIDTTEKATASIILAKKEAAKMGADAIINVKLTKLNSFAKRSGISGTAIKFVK